MQPQTTPKSYTKTGAPIEGARYDTDVLIEPQGAQGRSDVRQYLIIEGQAGFGAENGECSVSVLPMAQEDLTRLLLEHVASELERVDADRNDAHCLGDLSVDEIAMIPDRPTGLSAFMLTCETIADPNAFASKSRVLEIFVDLRDRKPVATFPLGTVQAAPEAVTAFLISLAQRLDGGRTNP